MCSIQMDGIPIDKDKPKLRRGRTGEKWPFVPICCELSKVCYVREPDSNKSKNRVLKKIGRYCPKHGLSISNPLF